MSDVYRTGRHLGRTIYRIRTDAMEDDLIGLMDTPELGALVVEALNARHRVMASVSVPLDRSPAPATCGRVGMHHCGITGRWQSHDTSEPLPEPPPGSYP
jgi:hypothetical protein